MLLLFFSCSIVSLCDPIDFSIPGFSVLHHLSELAQTYVQWVGDAIQSSRPLSSPSPPAFSAKSWPFASGGQSIGVSASASVLLMNSQGWFPLGLTPLISCSPRDFEQTSPTPEFKSIFSSVRSLLYGPTLMSIYDSWWNHSFDYRDLCWQSDICAFWYARFVIGFVPWCEWWWKWLD